MLHTAPDLLALKTSCRRSTADGSPEQMPVYLARPNDPPASPGAAKRPAILVLQEIFGVNDHIQDVARRFAAQGYVVAAPDLFYRSEPWISLGYTQEDHPRAFAEAGKLTPATLLGDVAAALDFLATQPGVDPDRIGVVGFCLGGRLSYMTGTQLPDRVHAVGIFYGGGLGNPALLAQAGDLRAPVIGFFGAKDSHIAHEHVAALDSALGAAGVQADIYYYPDADHGFFCNARATFHPIIAQDAWARTTAFFGRHLGPVPAVHWL